MKKASSLFFLLSSLLSLLPSPTSQNSINSTCKALSTNNANIDPGFCVTSLQAAPASRCASLERVGRISIQLIHDNVTDTECHIKQLLKRGRWDPYTEQCLGDCLELFSDGVTSVEDAMAYYKVRRFPDANLQISAVMTAANTCQEGFKEGGVDSPLTKRNVDTYGISQIVLAIMKEMELARDE